MTYKNQIQPALTMANAWEYEKDDEKFVFAVNLITGQNVPCSLDNADSATALVEFVESSLEKILASLQPILTLANAQAWKAHDEQVVFIFDLVTALKLPISSTEDDGYIEYVESKFMTLLKESNNGE
mgnify:CR=1 FL=1